MRSIKYYSLLLAIGLMTNTYAQNFNIKKLPLHVSYYGDNGFHPGLKLGTSYTFWSKEKSKVYRLNFRQNKYGNKTKFKELNLDYNLGFYSHPNNHLGLFTNVGLSYLRIKERKGRMFGVSFEVGYLRLMNKFKTYQLNSEGTIEQKKLAGNNAVVFSLAPVFGKEFTIANKPVRFYTKPIIQVMTYNHGVVPNASLEVGMTFNINYK